MKWTLLFFLLVTFYSFAQVDGDKSEFEKFPTTFALQLRGLANNRVLEGSLIEMNNDTVLSSIGMRNGFSFGGIIRRQYTDNLGIELGLIHNKRYFDLSGSILDTNATYSGDFAFTNYEIPIMGLAFVKFSERLFANVGLGFSTLYKPSGVQVKLVDQDAKRAFSFEGNAFNKFSFNVNAQVGLEYRTERKGTFYLGGSASIPTSPLFAYIVVYESPKQGIRTDQGVYIRSPFFTLDLRYYFPKIKNKGIQPNKGPIE